MTLTEYLSVSLKPDVSYKTHTCEPTCGDGPVIAQIQSYHTVSRIGKFYIVLLPRAIKR